MKAANILEQVDEPPQPTPCVRVDGLCRRVVAGGGQFRPQKQPDVFVRLGPLCRGSPIAGHIEVQRLGSGMLGKPREPQKLAPLLREDRVAREFVERAAFPDKCAEQDGSRRSVLLRLSV